MLTVLQAAILGIVEGITEFLPVSSTAHLILAADLLGAAQSDYVKSFEIVIQLGAILAVVWLYWRQLLDMRLWPKLAVAFAPTGLLGLLLYPFLKQYLLGNTTVVLWALALGGLLLIGLEKFFFEKRAGGRAAGHVAEPAAAPEDLAASASTARDLSYGRCLALGFFQAIAMVPGVSRSAATIVGGMLLGIDRRTIVEFSFLLAVPTMAAATGLDLLSSAGGWSRSEMGPLAIGFVVSFLTAIVAIRWLLKYVKGHSFAAFGVYRVALVLAFLAFLR